MSDEDGKFFSPVTWFNATLWLISFDFNDVATEFRKWGEETSDSLWVGVVPSVPQKKAQIHGSTFDYTEMDPFEARKQHWSFSIGTCRWDDGLY
ncbi:hypothetical protein SADUNF_Sadunf05G0175000 [Salix dunnii]|uniref:Uncharacterized protein n=1 Tax=Salix dunnii TaxID=1413687 RepID=A0A835K8X7_9ROSI|nr:hypothetical protein SADUNF_Sadunf05G0175000 [Salix dunnii]